MHANKRKISLLKRKEKSAIEMGQEEKQSDMAIQNVLQIQILSLTTFLSYTTYFFVSTQTHFPLAIIIGTFHTREGKKTEKRKHDITCFPLHQTPSIFFANL